MMYKIKTFALKLVINFLYGFNSWEVIGEENIQNLVSNITNKIESKINNGEIDKTVFEQQAKNIINSVQDSNPNPLKPSLPQVTGLPSPIINMNTKPFF